MNFDFFLERFLVLSNILPKNVTYLPQRFMDSTAARAPFECVCGFTAGLKTQLYEVVFSFLDMTL